MIYHFPCKSKSKIVVQVNNDQKQLQVISHKITFEYDELYYHDVGMYNWMLVKQNNVY